MIRDHLSCIVLAQTHATDLSHNLLQCPLTIARQLVETGVDISIHLLYFSHPNRLEAIVVVINEANVRKVCFPASSTHFIQCSLALRYENLFFVVDRKNIKVSDNNIHKRG